MAGIKPLCAPTSKPIILRPTHPNAGIEAAYRKRLRALIAEMNASILYWITAAYRAHPSGMAELVELAELAEDAMSPAGWLMRAVRGLARRWTRRFDEAAPKLADYFATAAAERSEASLKAILRDGGFTVAFKPSAAVKDILPATIQANVALIKSIPAQHFTQIEGMVMRSVQTGRDLQSLTKELRAAFGVTERRAAFIARDQNNKATAAITRARQLEVGITQAIWLHSAGGREPRPEHVAFSGKIYDVTKGAFLENKWVWPGTEINCRCVCKPVIPGLQ